MLLRTARQFTLVFIAIMHLGAASAEPEQQPRYSLRESYSASSDLLARGSLYPLDKRYSEFTQSQKEALRRLYVDMNEADEPPFPVEGMRRIVENLSRLTSHFKQAGELDIRVLVSASGEATSVKFVEHPNIELAQAVAYVLVKTKYKPGTCSGAPCEMELPFCFILRLE